MENNTMLLLQKTWKGKLADKDIEFVLERLENIDDKQALQLSSTTLKSPILVWIVSFFLGNFGIDRFYKGDIFIGMSKLIITLSMVALIWDVDDNDADLFASTLLVVVAFCEISTICSTQKDNFIKILKALASVKANK